LPQPANCPALIPQNTPLDATPSKHFQHPFQHDGLHLFANPLQAKAMGFGRGRVATFVGILGHSSRPGPRHQPPIAPGCPSHLAAGNPAAQNRSAPCAEATAATAAQTTSTTPGRASATASRGHAQSHTTGPGATGRSGGRAQHRAQTGHHGRGQQQPATCTGTCHSGCACACDPGTRRATSTHPCQRQRGPVRHTRLPHCLSAHGRRRHCQPALFGRGGWQSDPVRDRKKLGLQTP